MLCEMNGSPKKKSKRRVGTIMKSVIKQFRAPEKETFNGFMVCILFALFILYFIQFLVLYFAVGTKKDYLDMQGREKKSLFSIQLFSLSVTNLFV